MSQNTAVRLAREKAFHDRIARGAHVGAEFADRRLSASTPAGGTGISLRLCRDMLEAVGEPAGKKVLVLGCGMDSAGVWFARHGAQVDAIDISPKSVDVQRRLADRLGLRINATTADAHETGLPEASYDMVYGNAILHHLDCERAGREISRLLKPGGKAIFRDVAQGNVFLRLWRLLTPFWRTSDESPLRRSDYRTLGRIFERVDVSFYVLAALPYLLFWRLGFVLLSKFGKAQSWRKNLSLCALCDRIDAALLRAAPLLGSQAWLCIIRLRKPRRRPERSDTPDPGQLQ